MINTKQHWDARTSTREPEQSEGYPVSHDEDSTSKLSNPSDVARSIKRKNTLERAVNLEKRRGLCQQPWREGKRAPWKIYCQQETQFSEGPHTVRRRNVPPRFKGEVQRDTGVFRKKRTPSNEIM